MTSGLPPEKLINEYPETMARSLLRASLLKANLPPLWVQKMFEAIAGTLKKGNVKI